MSGTNYFENTLLNYIFLRSTAYAWQGATSFYVSLHSTAFSGSGEGATHQSISEATYTSYARVQVDRSTAGWTVTGSTAANSTLISFPACTGGSNNIEFFGIGTVAASSTGELLIYGSLSSTLAVSNGITPSFSSSQLNIQSS